MTDEHPTVSKIRARAKAARTFAQRGIIGIVVVVLAMIVLFYNDISGISGRLREDTGKARAVVAQVQSAARMPTLLWSPAADAPKLAEQISQMNVILRDNAEALEGSLRDLQAMANALMVQAALSLIMRLGSVILAIYLVQILAAFTRYHFRLADHLHAAADAVDLAGGETSHIEGLARALSPSAIDFGKPPKVPVEHALDTIRGLAKPPGNPK